MVKIEFEKGSAADTALQARIDAMKELKEKNANTTEKLLCVLIW